jgi:hypothetical protein
MVKASSRGMQRGVEEEEDLLSAQRYHRGMARQCPRGHDGTKPGEGTDDMSARHRTPPAPDLTQGKAEQVKTKLEVAMDETVGAGGDGAEGTRKKSTRSHG